MKKYFITGGCGFIGSNFIRYIFHHDDSAIIINLDKLTYAGNLKNLTDFQNDERYIFYHGDICNSKIVKEIFQQYKPDNLINFAAESHVDRSIGKPDDFIQTDIFGAFTLLETAREFGIERFIQISTDEVYGSIEKGSFSETDTLMPRNPYSASKAGADRLAYSYFTTYKLPVIITRASNNFGPYQFPEKLIPLFVTNAIEDKKLPVYGDGKNIRDWLYVEDHCSAIQYIIDYGKIGEIYNIGGGNELTNIAITNIILKETNKSETLKKFVQDRLGHDRRYSLNCEKLANIGWTPKHDFQNAMKFTVGWYKQNHKWWKPLKSGEYLEYYKKHYEELQ
ncbi:MAG: dTDP-glucose 4,6-dehydratase [Candidatus Neomarinimicrobiota bacterium]